MATADMEFTVTEDDIKEAVRNAVVFGNTTFSPVFVTVLRNTKQGFPMVGHEETHIVLTNEANELRRIYLRRSEEYGAGRMTAEQFRNSVQPLFDKVTDKKLRERQN
jgi:hypothetical protein